MVAHHSLHIGKGVGFQNDGHGLLVMTPSRMIHIAGDVLADRAGGDAGRFDTVKGGEFTGGFDVLIGKPRFLISLIGHHGRRVGVEVFQSRPCQILGLASGRNKPLYRIGADFGEISGDFLQVLPQTSVATGL